MTTTVVDGIGLLVTNTAAGEITGAHVVIDGDRIVAVGTGPGPAADERVDAELRCVIPGFVDSHTHLVFAGDRSAEFAARMAGAPYEAGGINVTIDATRAATDDELRTLGRGTSRRGPPGRHHDHRDQDGLRRDGPRRGPSGAAGRRAHGGHDVPRRPCRAARVRRTGRRLRGARRRGDAHRGRPPRPLGRRLLRARGVRRRPVPPRAGRRPGRRAGPAPARQPARAGAGRATRRRARLRLGGPLHVPLRRRRRGPGVRGHGGDVPPGDRLLDAPAVPRRPPGRSTPGRPSPWPPTATPDRATRRRCRSSSPSPCATSG